MYRFTHGEFPRRASGQQVKESAIPPARTTSLSELRAALPTLPPLPPLPVQHAVRTPLNVSLPNQVGLASHEDSILDLIQDLRDRDSLLPPLPPAYLSSLDDNDDQFEDISEEMDGMQTDVYGQATFWYDAGPSTSLPLADVQEQSDTIYDLQEARDTVAQLDSAIEEVNSGLEGVNDLERACLPRPPKSDAVKVLKEAEDITIPFERTRVQELTDLAIQKLRLKAQTKKNIMARLREIAESPIRVPTEAQRHEHYRLQKAMADQLSQVASHNGQPYRGLV